jgi:uncharacterized protein YycO
MNKKINIWASVLTSLILMSTVVSSANVIESTDYQPTNVQSNYDQSINEAEAFFPAQLQPGDLLFMDAKGFFVKYCNVPYVKNTATQKSNDHVALYIGVENGVHIFIEAMNYAIYFNSVNFTLQGKTGVQKTPWWKFYFWATNFTIGKVTDATAQQKQKAINHATALLGAGYQSAFSNYPPFCYWANPDITDPSNPYYHKTYYYPVDSWADKYFCAELVWACYLSITPSPINLDPDPKPDGTYNGNPAWGVYPNTLLYSTNMTFIQVAQISISYCPND